MAISAGTVVADAKMNMRGFMRDLSVMKKSGSRAAERVSRKWQQVGGQFQRVGGMLTAGLTAPLVGAGALALKTAADYESLRMSMNVLNKSVKEGARNFKRLKEFSAETPFQLRDLAQAQNMLQGFGLSADNAFQSMKMIGDIAAVASGDIKGIGIAFGQAAAEGRLMTRDIRQLINQGVPAIKLLADTMGVAKSEVLDLASEGKISFEILQQAFKDATSEGGMFANGMAKQAETLSGVWSTLKDNFSLALGEIGKALSEAFDIKQIAKDLISNLKSFTKWFSNLSPAVQRTSFIISGLVAAIGPISVVFGTILTMIPSMISGFNTLATAVKALTSAMITNPYYAVGAAIAFVGAKAVIAHQELKTLHSNVDDIISQGSDLDAVNKAIADIGKEYKKAAENAATIPGVEAEDLIDPKSKKQLQQLLALQRELASQEIMGNIRTEQLEDTRKLLAFINTDFNALSGYKMVVAKPFIEAKNPIHEVIPALDMVKDKFKELSEEQILADFKPEGLNLGEKIFPEGSLGALQERLQMLREKLQYATSPETITQLQEKIGLTREQINKLTAAAQKSGGVWEQLGKTMSNALAQAVLHGKNLMDVVKNLVKQLASKIFVQGLTALITGGSSLAAGSIGSAIFGGLFHGGGMVPGSGERMIRAKGGEMVLTASQQRALGGMMGGGGPTISPGAIGHAIGRELDKRLQRLSNNEIYAMAQKGRRAY